MKKVRVYVDTSVLGGCFDVEFSKESLRFFEQVKRGDFVLVISAVLLRELDRAPERVQKVLASIPSDQVEIVEDSGEVLSLRDAYLKAGVLGPASRGDAEHIASASVADVDFVMSWNFKHIVHYERISGFQAVNLMNGYKPIRIFSPKEVVNL
jgi:hypothetical protein